MHLLDLPNEILVRIITFLDAPSPLDLQLLEKPRPQSAPSPTAQESEDGSGIKLLRMPPSLLDRLNKIKKYPLKNLTLTCHLLRSLTVPILFKHATFSPLTLGDFLGFLKSQKLERQVASVVAHLPGHYGHIHPAWWARLLNEIPATRLSVVAAPEVLAELAGIHSWSNDAWAFDMPVQILRVEQSREVADCRIDYDNLPNFLTVRPWETVIYNEGF